MQNRSEKEVVNFFALRDTCRRWKPFRGTHLHIHPCILMSPTCFFAAHRGSLLTLAPRFVVRAILLRIAGMKYELRNTLHGAVHIFVIASHNFLQSIDRVLIDLSKATAFGRLFLLITSI